jgi:hypothetical protein
MPNIDIPIPDELQELLAAPKCLDLSFPPPKKMTVTLPGGGRIMALHDLGKSIPTDCSLTFSLMLQIMPFMANMECIVRILKLVKLLSDAITSLPPTPKLILDIGEAVKDLAECFVAITPAGMIPFVRDILCLILALLNCLIGQLKTLAEVMSGLTIQIQIAQDTGNKDLLATLECAQENSLVAMQHLMNGFGPIGVVMELMETFMGIAGIEAIKLPALGDASSAEELLEVITTLEEVVATIQTVVDALGGCPE